MSLADVKYNGKTVRKICAAVESSIMGLKELCEYHVQYDKSWPSIQTLYRWRARYPRFKDRLSKARRTQLSNRKEAIVDQIFAEKNPGMFTDRDGNMRYDSAYVNLLRLRHEVVNYNAKTNEDALNRPPLIINIPNMGK